MSRKSEPWYVHVPLYVVIAVLTYLLIQVAIIEPKETMQQERYFKAESRARMLNIRQAEILFEKEFGYYTNNLDSLFSFVGKDENILKMMTTVDTLTMKTKNPFYDLTNGAIFDTTTKQFVFDSLFHSPKSLTRYLLSTDSTKSIDTVINRWGRLVKIDTTIVKGTKYLLECPDGYGKVGDLFSDALKNTASWE